MSFQTTPESTPGEIDRRHQGREQRVGGDGGRERFLALPVPPDAEVQRQSVDREGVLEVQRVGVERVVGPAVTEEIGVAEVAEAGAARPGGGETRHGVAAGVAD